jgi:hypothetical protein
VAEGVTAGLPALLTFRPSPALRELQAETTRLVAIRAANGAGKTWAITQRIARYAVAHPNTRHRIVGPTRHHVREVTGRYLWHYLQGYLHPSSRWYAGTGWNRNGIILLANQTEIELRSNEDPLNAHEGRHDLGMIGLDEVPSYSVFMANKGRAHVQLLLAFTIQSKAPPSWLRPEIEGAGTTPADSPTEGRTQHSTGWVQYVIPLLRGNVPWMTETEYHDRVSSYEGTDEAARRLHAAWEGSDSARLFSGWSTSAIRTKAQLLAELYHPDGRARFSWARYGIDYGSAGPGKQCGYLIVGWDDRYYVLHEFQGTRTTTPREIAGGIVAAIDEWGLRIHHLEGIYGDINSAGPAGGGAQLNQLVGEELRLLLGLHRLPRDIQAPEKTGGWKESREHGINFAMLRGRWFVSADCHAAIQAYGNYGGQPRDPHKDSIDAQGYAVQDRVVSVPRAPGPTPLRH